MTAARLELARRQILGFRRVVGSLDARLPPGVDSLRQAAWAGLQDSMPRAALLSIHARVDGTGPSAWEDPSLVQVWGPRYSTYVVAARDRGVFTLGRYPDDARGRRVADSMLARLEACLDGRTLTYSEVGHTLGIHPAALRYAAPTGRVVIRWDAAGQPTVRTVPAPELDPFQARLELARRHLHVFGPSTPASFAAWAGIRPTAARAAFDALDATNGSLTAVRTPIGDGWVLAEDEAAFRAPAGPPASARLLPSGDAYLLLQGRERELLVPDPGQRLELWPSRVWPGAVLVGGDVVGTWRRADANLSIRTWRRLSADEREAVEAEAASLPLPGTASAVAVRWDGEVR